MRRVSPGTWFEVFERDKGVCKYCGEDLLSSLSAYRSATVDHIVAQCAGGSHKAENLVLCCIGCNNALSQSRNRQTIEERRAHVLVQRQKATAKFDSLRKKLRSPGAA